VNNSNLKTINVKCEDNYQFTDLLTGTTVGQLKDLLTESLGRELAGNMYFGEDRISYSKTLETFVVEPYSLSTGTEIELLYKEKNSESSKKRKSNDAEEKSTKKQPKSKN
jgi:hypothetical protein